jgi:hypothetical protein
VDQHLKLTVVASNSTSMARMPAVVAQGETRCAGKARGLAAQRIAFVHVHCLQKARSRPAIQQQIAFSNLVNSASVLLAGRFSTACGAEHCKLCE